MDFLKLKQQLNKVLSLIKEMHIHNHNYINLVKLAKTLELSSSELDEIVEMILKFQDIFTDMLPEKQLVKLRKKGTWYLTLTTNSDSPTRIELHLTREECNFLSDLVHYFQHVAKGKGFNLRFPTSDFVMRVKQFSKSHPYFFECRGNGLVYPATLALKLGVELEQYNRMNRAISRVKCEEHLIIIE